MTKTVPHTITERFGEAQSVSEVNYPVRAWNPEPYQIVSLWDMIQYSVKEFCEVIRLLELQQRLLTEALNCLPDNSDRSLEESEKIMSGALLPRLRAVCEGAELEYAASAIDEMERHLGYSTVRDWLHEITTFYRALNLQLGNRLFLFIPLNRITYYEHDALFGDEVTNAFPSTRDDVKAAGNCYALGQYTACVFHLMRVMEVALKTLRKTLDEPNLNPRQNPSWERILERFRTELNKDFANRSDAWKQNEALYAELSVHLHSVKDAWRNPTMHVEKNYDEAQAYNVLVHVRAFMQHISQHLRERTD